MAARQMGIFKLLHEIFTGERHDRLNQIRQWRWFANALRTARRQGCGISLSIERDDDGNIYRMTAQGYPHKQHKKEAATPSKRSSL